MTWTEKESNAAGQLVVEDSDTVRLQAVNLPRSSNGYDGVIGDVTLLAFET